MPFEPRSVYELGDDPTPKLGDEMADKPGHVKAGHYYYARTQGGPLEPRAPGSPDMIVCRRLRDFPAEALPADAAITGCEHCGFAIVFNPARHYTAPLVCMQCMNITPDPL